MLFVRWRCAYRTYNPILGDALLMIAAAEDHKKTGAIAGAGFALAR
jgi:hypothetical protein